MVVWLLGNREKETNFTTSMSGIKKELAVFAENYKERNQWRRTTGPPTSKTMPVSEWSPSSDNTLSTVSENPSPLISPFKTDRKRSYKLKDYRGKDPIASTDLDYKER
ncbi:unnamed protein product [Porites evermanni]|uniref:Uncharacterized protein n=1 Tax=Porites evermanni TaxID=104178 RepID=A0ABN8LSN1_9CNID|nr:unnamed protein product [Porites evermanni]